jgi:hypothetical protein
MMIGDKIITWIIEHPMVLIVVLLLFVLLTTAGCTRQRIGIELFGEDVYTRAEVDAINAEKQCKQTARNSLDMARCTGNRRGP